MKAKNKLIREARQKINRLWDGRREVDFGRWRRWIRHKKTARVSGGRSAGFYPAHSEFESPARLQFGGIAQRSGAVAL